MLAQRLRWVDSMCRSIQRGCDKVSSYRIEFDEDDPLHTVVTVFLREPLEEGSARAVQHIIQGWSSINDAHARRVRTYPGGVIAEVFIKYRGGGECNVLPWDPRPTPKSRHSQKKRDRR